MSDQRWVKRILTEEAGGRRRRDCPRKKWLERILTEEAGGRRRRDCPRKKWLEELKKDLREVGVRNWQKEALERRTWQRRVKDLTAKGHAAL
ncbi:hypothetical protein QE152_g1809 [Popillia japonica]|uniref:Uncharacterized protein n=1 Tax=Popillia japonica TaxID=7064 RepID=A0AAW1N5K8_POPJA